MTGHTKEPWGFHQYTNTNVEGAAGRTIATTGGYSDNFSDGAFYEENLANARRIVDCVNSMAGIPDPAAYVAAMGKVVKAAQEQLDYMDLCNDKGDLERNLRTALAAFRTAMGETQP